MFKGSGVALITPFNEDLTINYNKLGELIDFHIENKTDAIIVLGTTGESATITDEEKKKIIDYSISKTKGKIPLIVGTGSNDTNHAIELSKYAASKKVDALLIVTPYYNKTSQDGLFLHYKNIAKNVQNTPIILYNVPSRTGVNIEIETIIKLSKIKNIIGIKEANNDISRIAYLRRKKELENFYIYSGNDDLTFPILSLGGDGVISVLANIYPNEIHNLCYEYFNGNTQKARNIYFNTFELSKKLFIDVNPIPIKEAMNYLNFNVGKYRLPLTTISNENKKILIECINNYKEAPKY